MLKGACADLATRIGRKPVTDLFFDEKELRIPVGTKIKRIRMGSSKAKEICRACPLILSCLTNSLTSNNGKPEAYGVFGGLDAFERRNLVSILKKEVTK